MGHIAGTIGGVYTGTALVIHDCETDWDEQVVGNVTRSNPAGKVGNCIRASTVGVGAVVLMSKVISLDLSTYEAACWWARTNLAGGTVNGDLALLLDEHVNCASPSETLNIPALTLNTWHHCFGVFAGITTSRDLLISVGLKSVVDLGDGTFDIDDVEALNEITGIKSWTLDYTSGIVDVTDFGSTGTRDVLPAVNQWSGSFEGYKDGIPLSIGTEYYLIMGESNTDYQGWLGKALITGAHPNVAFDGTVSYSYDFEGTGALETPSA